MDLHKAEEVIRPLVEQNGFILYDVEFIGRTLRVCIDKPETGVTIQDCVDTSRMLNPVLDTDETLISGGSYELEVGSPGLDRKLRKAEHFKGAVGEKVHVTTTEPMSLWNGSEAYFEKRKNIRGVLKEFDGEKLTVFADERNVVIPQSAITKAYIDFELQTTPKKGKKV